MAGTLLAVQAEALCSVDDILPFNAIPTENKEALWQVYWEHGIGSEELDPKPRADRLDEALGEIDDSDSIIAYYQSMFAALVSGNETSLPLIARGLLTAKKLELSLAVTSLGLPDRIIGWMAKALSQSLDELPTAGFGYITERQSGRQPSPGFDSSRVRDYANEARLVTLGSVKELYKPTTVAYGADYRVVGDPHAEDLQPDTSYCFFQPQASSWSHWVRQTLTSIVSYPDRSPHIAPAKIIEDALLERRTRQ